MFNLLSMLDRGVKAKHKKEGREVTLEDSSLNANFISFRATRPMI